MKKYLQIIPVAPTSYIQLFKGEDGLLFGSYVIALTLFEDSEDPTIQNIGAVIEDEDFLDIEEASNGLGVINFFAYQRLVIAGKAHSMGETK